MQNKQPLGGQCPPQPPKVTSMRTNHNQSRKQQWKVCSYCISNNIYDIQLMSMGTSLSTLEGTNASFLWIFHYTLFWVCHKGNINAIWLLIPPIAIHPFSELLVLSQGCRGHWSRETSWTDCQSNTGQSHRQTHSCTLSPGGNWASKMCLMCMSLNCWRITRRIFLTWQVSWKWQGWH